MIIEVLGSGGAVTTPKVFCNCVCCNEARKKGIKYSRTGPSVFIHGPDILIDTPEEICIQLNRSNIKNINTCLFSHWHPDHTAGKRVFEANIDWINIPPRNKLINIYLPEKLVETFKKFYGIYQNFEFFEKQKIVKITSIKNDETFMRGNYKITPIQMSYNYVFGYRIENENNNILILMDEIKNWEPSDDIINKMFDIIYLPAGAMVLNPITNERIISDTHPILESEQTIQETMELISKLNSKKFIISHIEEPDKITISMGKKLGKFYSKILNKKIIFATDKMKHSTN